MKTTRWRSALAGTMTAALLAAWGQAAAPATAVEEASAAPTRVMVVGDSISHASVGDYSWRYFAWKHLAAAGAGVDFVGPRRAPFVGEGATWPAVYADAAFDQDHAAMWGDQLFMPRHDRDALMTTYAPDVVVVELGVNDMLWVQATAEQTQSMMRTWVAAARTRVPEADFVLVEAPWTNSPVAADYNQRLAALAWEMTTSASRVVVARTTPGYVMGTGLDVKGDTYDPLHPNTSGQVKIAAAVTDALATLGVGKAYPRPLRIPAEGPRVVPVLKGSSTDAAARWTWSVPPGATSYDVWVRRPGKKWVREVRALEGTSYRISGLRKCQPYDVRVLARKGWTLAGQDVRSPVVTAQAGPKVAGRATVRATARGRTVRTSWSAVKGACAHRVKVTVKAPGARATTRFLDVKGTSTVLRRLTRGSVVRVSVRGVGARNLTRWSKVRTLRLQR